VGRGFRGGGRSIKPYVAYLCASVIVVLDFILQVGVGWDGVQGRGLRLKLGEDLFVQGQKLSRSCGIVCGLVDALL